MRTTGKFYIIDEHSDKIKAWFITSLPILWNRNGEYRVIPKAVVQNAIDNKAMYEKLSDKTVSPIVSIMWSQGIPISNQAGRALVGE